MTTANSPDSSTTVGSPLVPQVPVTLDTKGRVRTSKGQRRTLLAEFERSGLSAAQFAKRTGLKYSTLAGWLQRARRHPPLKRARRLRLLEAVVEATPGAVAGAALVLHLPGGARVEVADEKQAALAARLVRALAQPC
jgi:transcriptional regulator with XRE-family HTH domain